MLGAAVTALAGHAVPAVSAVAPLRRRLWPDLSGTGRPDHVALTFDDGPDRRSTPRMLRALAEADVRATFFLLGAMLDHDHALGREIVAAGHEVAVHGWAHRNLLGRSPWGTYTDIARAHDLVSRVTGTEPRWYRPPYGVLTGAALVACRRLGLRPRLWTAWGRDWTAEATPASVYREVTGDLTGGGTVLLHDADGTGAPGAWQATLGALPLLVAWARERGLTVGPLGSHRAGSPPAPPPGRRWRPPARPRAFPDRGRSRAGTG
ncbi:polysaccharide deacetylase family protein [Micromonospora cathayae]|uniref:Polysaccharide deacetylase family protein n=1 Tax=Micromonospora cathayae TaxID=3028804 RepID=A0ABY8A232_9ACTN|nr:polysaccharide deacetylase family protein [Micromonospora sp. HUAS 3]WDZ88154.1 polysaccharide deacetylase family protein [Micromonospora sp. HUAS 3]